MERIDRGEAELIENPADDSAASSEISCFEITDAGTISPPTAAPVPDRFWQSSHAMVEGQLHFNLTPKAELCQWIFELLRSSVYSVYCVYIEVPEEGIRLHGGSGFLRRIDREGAKSNSYNSGRRS
jgi:hypothetical protein